MEFQIKSRDHGVVTFCKPGREAVYMNIHGGPWNLGNQLCEGGKFRGPTIAAGDCTPEEFAALCRKWWRAYLRNGGR